VGPGRPVTLAFSLATSPVRSPFGPLLYSGRVEQAVAMAAELGFDGVELSLRAADEVDEGWLTRELERRGLRVSALGSGRALLEDGLCFSDPDAEVRRAALERLEGHLRLGARLGAPVIIGLIRGARVAEEGREVALGRIAACLARAAERAAAAGTSLLIEPINRYETDFCNTTGETLDLLDRAGCADVGLLLDLFHMNIEEASIVGALRLAGERLVYLHLADSNRWAPGFGHTPFGPVRQVLDEMGFAGWVSAEILPRPDDDVAVRQWRSFAHAFWSREEA
jgi:5-keto-L-gluconate epimerase